MIFKALRKVGRRHQVKAEATAKGLHEARVLVRKGENRKALTLLRQMNLEGTELQNCLEIKATALSALGDYESSLECLSKAAKSAHPGNWDWRLTRTPIRELNLEGKELNKFWKSCMGPLDECFESAKQHVLNGESASASRAIRQLHDENLSEDSLRQLDEIFSLLTESQTDCSVPSKAIPTPIFLMGTGSSGTSAIYSYLLEYENVTGIQGEPPFFGRGTHTLFDIKKSLHEKARAQTLFVNFTFEKLIGFGLPNGETLINFSYARKLWDEINQESHFVKVKNFVSLGRGLWSDAGQKLKHELLNALAHELIENFIIKRSILDGERLVFRNPIPAQNVDASTVFQRSKIVISVRDPRATYATLRQTESSWFTVSAEYWAQRTKIWRALLEEKTSTMIQNNPGHHISIVQFEEFVLSSKLRFELATSLGLIPEKAKTHSRFKPWESVTNTLIHEAHTPQSDIEFIEQELPEYCVDLGLRANNNS